jgi:Mg2+ and Co2+ transporter CorA
MGRYESPRKGKHTYSSKNVSVDIYHQQLLQLHPLTLEDILRRESREKFEHFPRLGYYFVVFRAVDRPEPVQREDDETSFIQGLPELTDVLETTNIYLVVFKEGICVFHFEDISRHMDALKKKVLSLVYSAKSAYFHSVLVFTVRYRRFLIRIA